MTIRVVVNDAVALKGMSGSARVSTQLIEAMSELAGVQVGVVRPTRARRASKVLNACADTYWDLRGAAAAAGGADVLVSPCNVGRASRRQRHLLVVYDAMIWESARFFDPAFAAYARRMFKFSLKRADRVLTVSDHSRLALLDLVPAADIRVITPPGRRNPGERSRWLSGHHTVLMIGETAAHKNHVAGIGAVRALRARTGAPLSLRLIGRPGNAEADVKRSLAAADPAREWTRRDAGLTDSEVDDAFSKAWMLLQPSENEGFGLPLVEASQRGLPVLHSGRGGMSEVLPESSLDSTDASSFERGLEKLLDQDAWNRAATSVYAQSARFSFEQFRSAIDSHLRDLVGRTVSEVSP